MKITFSYNYNTDETRMKPDKDYQEQFNDDSRIHKLDFLQDAIALLQAELDILVEQILTAKDLVKLQEVTLKNFPDKCACQNIKLGDCVEVASLTSMSCTKCGRVVVMPPLEPFELEIDTQSTPPAKPDSLKAIKDFVEMINHCDGLTTLREIAATKEYQALKDIIANSPAKPDSWQAPEGEGWIAVSAPNIAIPIGYAKVQIKLKNGDIQTGNPFDRTLDWDNCVAYRITKEPEQFCKCEMPFSPLETDYEGYRSCTRCGSRIEKEPEQKKQTLLEFAKDRYPEYSEHPSATLLIISQYLEERG